MFSTPTHRRRDASRSEKITQLSTENVVPLRFAEGKGFYSEPKYTVTDCTPVTSVITI